MQVVVNEEEDLTRYVRVIDWINDVTLPKAKVFFWTKVLGKLLLTSGQKQFSMVKSVFRPS